MSIFLMIVSDCVGDKFGRGVQSEFSADVFTMIGDSLNAEIQRLGHLFTGFSFTH